MSVSVNSPECISSNILIGYFSNEPLFGHAYSTYLSKPTKPDALYFYCSCYYSTHPYAATEGKYELISSKVQILTRTKQAVEKWKT